MPTQRELEKQITLFLTSLGEEKEVSGLCNAWTFMNFMNDVLDQKDTNTSRMQALKEQNPEELAGFYREYKAAYIALMEEKKEGEIAVLNHQLEEEYHKLTKLRKEKDEKTNEKVKWLEQEIKAHRNKRSELIEQAMLGKFGADTLKKMHKAEDLYFYIHALLAAVSPGRNFGYRMQDTESKENRLVEQADHLEILKLISSTHLTDQQKEVIDSVKIACDIAFTFTHSELVNLFNNEIPNTICEGDMIQVDRPGHVFYVSFKNGKFLLYNPDFEPPEHTAETLVEQIKLDNFPKFDDNKDYIPLRLVIATKTNLDKIKERPDRKKIIENILNERKKSGNPTVDGIGWGNATALYVATLAGHADIVEQLLGSKSSAYTNLLTNEGSTPLATAIARDYTKIATMLANYEKESIHHIMPGDKDSLLFKALRRGRAEFIGNLLDLKISIDMGPNNNAACTAAQFGHADILKVLHDKDIDCNAPPIQGGPTPAEIAASNGHWNVIESLIKLDKINGETNSPMLQDLAFIAASNGHWNVIEHLIKLGKINVETNSPILQKLAFNAASNGHWNVIESLIKLGKINVETNSPMLQDLAFIAASNGHFNIIEQLNKQHELRLDIIDKNRLTLGLTAAKGGHVKFIDAFIKSLVEQKKINLDEDSTPLHQIAFTAAENGHCDVIDHLKKQYKLSLDITNQDGNTLVTLAAQENKLDLIRYLSNQGADFSLPTKDGRTPLDIAVEAKNSKMVGLIAHRHIAGVAGWIDSKADMDVSVKKELADCVVRKGEAGMLFKILKKLESSSLDKPFLHDLAFIAAGMGHLDIIEHLNEQYGVSLDIVNEKGLTLGAMAVMGDQASFVEAFVANTKMDEAKKLTLAFHATEYNRLNIVKLLEPNFNKHDTVSGNTLATFAAAKNNLAVIQYLADQKADLSIPTKDGWTPLRIAAHAGNLEIVEFIASRNIASVADLIKSKVDINIPVKRKLAVCAAQQKKFSILVSLLDGIELRLLDNIFLHDLKFMTKEEKLALALHAAKQGNISILASILDGIELRLLDNMFLHNLTCMPEEDRLALAPYDAKNDNPKIIDILAPDLAAKKSNGETLATYAAEEGKWRVIEYLAYKKVDLSIANDHKLTPLHIAVNHKDRDMVRAIASSNIANVKPLLPLSKGNVDISVKKELAFCAAEQGDVDILVNVLTSMQEESKSPFLDALAFAATKYGHFNIIKHLNEQHQVSLDITNSNGETLATYAAEKGKWRVIEYLADKKVDLSIPNKDKLTPLHIAVNHKDIDMVRTIASSNIAKEEKLALAFHAAKDDYPKIIDILAPDLAAKNSDGETLATYAAEKGKWRVIEYLAYKKVDLSVPNDHGLTPLRIAVNHKDRDMVRAIASSNIANVKPLLPLSKGDMDIYVKAELAFCAAEQGNVDILDNVLTSMQEEFKLPFFHDLAFAAAKYGRFNIIKHLNEQRQVSFDINNSKNQTLAEVAIIEGHKAFIADFATTTKMNEERKLKLAFYAINNGRMDIINVLATPDLLKSHNQEKKGHTLVTWAIAQNNLEAIKYLANKKADLSLPGQDGRTPLHIAIQDKNIEAIRILVDHKADLSRPDQDGRTPLHIAIQNKNIEAIRILVDHKGDLYSQSAGKSPIDLADSKISAFITLYQLKKYINDNNLGNSFYGLPAKHLARIEEAEQSHEWKKALDDVIELANTHKTPNSPLLKHSVLGSPGRESTPSYLEMFAPPKNLKESLAEWDREKRKAPHLNLGHNGKK